MKGPELELVDKRIARHGRVSRKKITGGINGIEIVSGAEFEKVEQSHTRSPALDVVV